MVAPLAAPSRLIASYEVTDAALQQGFVRPLGKVCGPVIRGLRLGHRLGFPTANVALSGCDALPSGVYAVRSRLADGRTFIGVASVGCNPTVPKNDPVLEVWLFDFDEDIYGQLLETELLAFLREERRFPSLEALQEQILRDAAEARALLEFLVAARSSKRLSK